jgi:mannose-1-phosphate guanylyltransferase
MKAVILAGGSGTRLWPISRKSKPKQFQSLTGKKTMLQETVARLNFLKPSNIFIATNKEYLRIVRQQTRGHVPAKNIIVEPAMRDTAPGIGLAALYLAAACDKKHPGEVMAVIYADHLIRNGSEFRKKLEVAEKLAHEENTLNIIEVKARFPNVNLGYVKTGKLLKKISGCEIHSFERFTEKPDLAKAKEFLKSRNYLWNTGLYVWRIDTILEQYKKFLPKTWLILSQIKRAIGTKKEKEVLEKLFPQCEKISVDYGIMEKTDPKKVRIIPSDLRWSDVGTWESIHDELADGPKSNLVKGNHLGIDTEGCLIYGYGKKLIATIGLKDLVVVETGDALLVCKKNRSQDVKKIVETLKNSSKYKKLL